MKIKKPFTSLAFVLAASAHAIAQGTFQNLDFEAANVSGYGAGAAIPIASAFPAWQVFNGTSPVSSVAYDAVSTGAALIGIQDGQYGYTPIQGSYTAFLQGAWTPFGAANVTLSQTGIVPSGTESIELDANESQAASFVVTLGGQTVTMVPLQTFSGYTVYGGNISAWSGQNTTLNITEMGPANEMFSPSLLALDDITFSPMDVTPEPDGITLLGIGGLLFGLYRRFWKICK